MWDHSSAWLERSAHNRVVKGSNPFGPIIKCSSGVVRPIMQAFRACDSGSNPGWSTLYYYICILFIGNQCAGVVEPGQRRRT